MFSPDDIQNRIRQRPFVPLRVVTSSGESIEIRHPDLVLVGRRDLIVGVPTGENPTHYDGLNRVALMHVTALEDLPVSKSTDGNGR